MEKLKVEDCPLNIGDEIYINDIEKIVSNCKIFKFDKLSDATYDSLRPKELFVKKINIVESLNCYSIVVTNKDNSNNWSLYYPYEIDKKNKLIVNLL